MGTPRGDSEQTKAEILAAAQRLFAEQGISAVSVRDVASEAGVTHGLIHHYFGTKEQLAAAAIRAAVSASAEVLVANPVDTDLASLDVMRRVLRYFLTDGKGGALLLARAELGGFEPEKPTGVVAMTAATTADCVVWSAHCMQVTPSVWPAILIATLRPGGSFMPPRPSADSTVCTTQRSMCGINR